MTKSATPAKPKVMDAIDKARRASGRRHFLSTQPPDSFTAKQYAVRFGISVSAAHVDLAMAVEGGSFDFVLVKEPGHSGAPMKYYFEVPEASKNAPRGSSKR